MKATFHKILFAGGDFAVHAFGTNNTRTKLK